jgi:hypothetical protein
MLHTAKTQPTTRKPRVAASITGLRRGRVAWPCNALLMRSHALRSRLSVEQGPQSPSSLLRRKPKR